MSKPKEMKRKITIIYQCKVFSNENDSLRLYIYKQGKVFLLDKNNKRLNFENIPEDLYKFPYPYE